MNLKKRVQVVDVDKIRSTLMNEMKITFMELAVTQVEEQMKKMQRFLPSREEERLDRINAIMAERKVIRMLEEEAIDLWEKKPEEKRMIKIGWFRKKEDGNKRDQFINDHIDEYFETYLKKEFDV